MSAVGKVALVGTGLIGRGWATAFARAGWRAELWDRDPAAGEAARDAVYQMLDDLEAAGLLKDSTAAKSRITVADTLANALDGASYVQESVPEDRDIKNAVIGEIDRIARPEALICSSTSTMPGSVFLADIPGRKRCIVAHPANPPHLMPVVEIVPSPWHARETVDRVRAVLASIGQVPVIIHKEIEGFVMNRLQTSVVNEAVALVAGGVIDPADLDAVMKHSLGMRWALMGPFETMDLNAPGGFLDYATRYGSHYQTMGRDLSVAALWPDQALRAIEDTRRHATPKSKLPQRTRWRDKALMRLLALKEQINTANPSEKP